MKPKIFLNSSDVADITGYSLRNARKILDWVRTEKGLVKRQAVSIFHYCECFDLPVNIVFEYINNKDFKVQSLNLYEIQKTQSLGNFKNVPNLNLEVFEPLIHKPRK